MKTYFILFATLIFTIGLVYTWARWGIKKSISATFYEHENRFLWYLWCLLYAGPMLIIGHGLIFLSVFGIALVGVEPDFKGSKMRNFVHCLGAYTAILSSFSFLALQGIWLPIALWGSFTLGAKLLKLRNSTTWIEVAAYYLAVIGLLIF